MVRSNGQREALQISPFPRQIGTCFTWLDHVSCRGDGNSCTVSMAKIAGGARFHEWNGILWTEWHRRHQNRRIIYDVSVKRRCYDA